MVSNEMTQAQECFRSRCKSLATKLLLREKSTNVENMDSCHSVERELERLAKKYSNLREHTDSSLTELIYQIVTIQEDLLKASKDGEVPPLQLHLLNQSCRKIKDTVSKVATEHKELHGGISKIGKAIDRVCYLNTWNLEKISIDL